MFVTEERLHQFGNELHKKLVSAITEVVSQQKTADVATPSKPRSDWKNRPYREKSGDVRKGPVKCFGCQEEGHYFCMPKATSRHLINHGR